MPIWTFITILELRLPLFQSGEVGVTLPTESAKCQWFQGKDRAFERVWATQYRQPQHDCGELNGR
jgi:hypothetical protein